MDECIKPAPLPKKPFITEKDLTSNHKDAMEDYQVCATDKKCLVDWINKRDR